jgi:hypothetical protein
MNREELKKKYLVDNYYFVKIGEYNLVNNDLERNIITNKLLTKECKLVYAFIVDDLVMYIGKTKQGFCRPLSYHRDYNNSKKSRSVHEGIREVISKSKIEIFARVFKPITFEKFKINPYVGVEEAIIENYRLEWNNLK